MVRSALCLPCPHWWVAGSKLPRRRRVLKATQHPWMREQEPDPAWVGGQGALGVGGQTGRAGLVTTESFQGNGRLLFPGIYMCVYCFIKNPVSFSFVSNYLQPRKATFPSKIGCH